MLLQCGCGLWAKIGQSTLSAMHPKVSALCRSPQPQAQSPYSESEARACPRASALGPVSEASPSNRNRRVSAQEWGRRPRHPRRGKEAAGLSLWAWEQDAAQGMGVPVHAVQGLGFGALVCAGCLICAVLSPHVHFGRIWVLQAKH